MSEIQDVQLGRKHGQRNINKTCSCLTSIGSYFDLNDTPKQMYVVRTSVVNILRASLSITADAAQRPEKIFDFVIRRGKQN